MQKGIIKNVNKLTGEPIDAKDLASMLSGIIGNESGVLTVFDELRLEKISDNKVRLHSGVYSLKGHILYIPKGSYEDFEIESGTLGANRIDLLVAEYVKNGEGDGEDTLRFRIVKGKATSGTPEEPPLIQQDINENGITYQQILYQISMKNTNIQIKNRCYRIKSNLDLSSYIDTKVNQSVVGELLNPGIDLDQIITPGIYSSNNTEVAKTIKNSPTDIAFIMHVYERNKGNSVQKIIEYNGKSEYVRGKNTGSWSKWGKVSRDFESGDLMLTPTESIGQGWYRIEKYIKFKTSFKSWPRVTVSARTSSPHLVFASFHGVTSEGFTITYVRPNKSAGQVDWIAIERD